MIHTGGKSLEDDRANIANLLDHIQGVNARLSDLHRIGLKVTAVWHPEREGPGGAARLVVSTVSRTYVNATTPKDLEF